MSTKKKEELVIMLLYLRLLPQIKRNLIPLHGNDILQSISCSGLAVKAFEDKNTEFVFIFYGARNVAFIVARIHSFRHINVLVMYTKYKETLFRSPASLAMGETDPTWLRAL